MCPIPPIKLRSTASISNEAVEEATGRGWPAWMAFLDARGGASLEHRGIVALLAGEGGVESGWWQQTIAVSYEKATGHR
ncbi:MAG: hypothetical protein AUK47_22395 [Deltaproteobacteria bacterium CG2_30_63_29]|nr:MAG: hypothetical protein AUK47_22395 [Deltaproteobacteria bacterium CG2_30_63_29]PJB43032.1 MAG: hypothetical protein CO108_10740 [Deltaproteobacteria bacterium CG_4_9_14_3_um_filter_63_12]